MVGHAQQEISSSVVARSSGRGLSLRAHITENPSAHLNLNCYEKIHKQSSVSRRSRRHGRCSSRFFMLEGAPTAVDAMPAEDVMEQRNARWHMPRSVVAGAARWKFAAADRRVPHIRVHTYIVAHDLLPVHAVVTGTPSIRVCASVANLWLPWDDSPQCGGLWVVVSGCSSGVV